MTSGNDETRGRAARTAAQWFVDLDAGTADPGKEAAFAAWLAEDSSHERELERCEAAVDLAQELEHDADLRWAFDEAARLPAPPRERAPRSAVWHQRPALAWSVAALAVAAAVVAVASREWLPGAATMAPATAYEVPPVEVVVEPWSGDPVVVLPGQIVVDARSVAVLPFVGVGEESGQTGNSAATSAIAAQLYDDVVRQLAAIPGVYVVARQAVVPYENRNMSPVDVAAQLGVRGIVEARVASEGGRVRVLLQVNDAAGEGVSSEDSFDRPIAELRTIQTEIVTNIAVKLASAAAFTEPTARE